MSYGRIKFGIFLSLIIYLIGGYVFTTSTKEMYPFFSWNMFNRVPNEISQETNLIVHSAGDKVYSPPLFLKDTPEIYNSSKDITMYLIMVRKLGESIYQNQADDTNNLRAELESNFTKHPVIYEIVKIKFKTLDILKKDRALEITSLAKFNSGDPNNTKF